MPRTFAPGRLPWIIPCILHHSGGLWHEMYPANEKTTSSVGYATTFPASLVQHAYELMSHVRRTPHVEP